MDDGSNKVQVYRKTTDIVQYVNWDSGHHCEHNKISGVDSVVTLEKGKTRDEDRSKEVLKVNVYKPSMFNNTCPQNGQQHNQPNTPSIWMFRINKPAKHTQYMDVSYQQTSQTHPVYGCLASTNCHKISYNIKVLLYSSIPHTYRHPEITFETSTRQDKDCKKATCGIVCLTQRPECEHR